MNRTLKTITIIVIIITVIACGLFAYFFTRDAVGIPNNFPYFGMTKSMLILQKGQPKEIKEYEVNQTFIMTYEDDIFGNDCEVDYTFFRSTLCSDLYDVKLYTDNIDYGSARIVFNKVVANQNNLRSNDKGYNYTDYSDEDNEYMKAEIKTDDGATGITFVIEYQNHALTISSNYLR